MTASTSLIEMILNLLRNPSELAAFQQNPSAYLDACGAGHVTPADVHDALVLADDHHEEAGRHHDAGNHIQLPPAPPAPHPAPGESEHEAAVRYLNTYVTNNYIDDRDTTVDNSVHQKVDTHGGNFDQNIDVRSTVASGDGAVAAGHDISGSTVTTGHDNQVGDGNVKGTGNVVGDDNQAVTADHGTTAFGSGNATSTDVGHNLSVADGGAFASGGAATVDNSDNSVNDSGNTSFDVSVRDSFNNSSDNSTQDSHNVDTSTQDSHNVDASVNDSGNTTTDVHDNPTLVDNSLHDVANVDSSVNDSGNVAVLPG